MASSRGCGGGISSASLLRFTALLCLWAAGAQAEAAALAPPTVIAENGDLRLTANDVIFEVGAQPDLRASSLVGLAERVEQQEAVQAATANLIDTSLGPRVKTLEALVASLMETVATQAATVERLLADDVRARGRIRNLELRLETVEALANATGAELRDLREHFGFPIGVFTTVPTVINSPTELQAWQNSDVDITTNSCSECVLSFPMFLHGAGGRTSYDQELATVQSYLGFRYPQRWPVDHVRPKASNGKLNGRALFKQANALRGETDTEGCTTLVDGLCTGAAVSAYEVYVSPILSVAPTLLQAPATANVTVPNNDGAFDLVQQWTLEAVVRVQLSTNGQDPDSRLPTRISYYYPIIEKTARVGVNEDTFVLRVSFDGVDASRFSVHTCLERATDDVDFCVSTGEAKFSVNEWLHLAAVYNGNRLAVFVEGVLQASQVIGAVTAYTGPAPLSIGSNRYTNHGGIGTFVGAIDEIRVWSVALSDERIAAAAATPFASSDAPALAGLVAAYDFELDGAVPGVVRDASAGARSGTVFNAVWVAGRRAGSRALYFMDDGHPVGFFPPLPENDWVAFVPASSIQCSWGQLCNCTGAAASAYRVYRGVARPRLAPGTYAVCHAAGATSGASDSLFVWQSGLSVSAAATDPCFGIDCGAFGTCNQTTASCVCLAGWTGPACRAREAAAAPDGRTPASAARSCRDIREAYAEAAPDGLYHVTLGKAAAVQVWCDMARGGWTVLLQFAPSVVSPGEFLAGYLRAGPLGGMVDRGTPTTAGLPTAYTRVAREDTYTNVSLGCWRAGDSSPQPLATLPLPWIGTKLLAGAAPAARQTLADAFTQFRLSPADDTLEAVFLGGFAVREPSAASLCAAKDVADNNQLVLMVR